MTIRDYMAGDETICRSLPCVAKHLPDRALMIMVGIVVVVLSARNILRFAME